MTADVQGWEKNGLNGIWTMVSSDAGGAFCREAALHSEDHGQGPQGTRPRTRRSPAAGE